MSKAPKKLFTAVEISFCVVGHKFNGAKETVALKATYEEAEAVIMSKVGTVQPTGIGAIYSYTIEKVFIPKV